MFSDLPTDLQNIYMTNFEFFFKFIFILIILSICIYFIKYSKQNKTPYIFLAFFKGILKFLSYCVLFILPLISVFILYPQFDFNIIITYLGIIYIVLIFVFCTIFLLNIIFWFPVFLMKWGGYDPFKDKTNKIINDLSFLTGIFYSSKNKIINKIKKT